MERITEKDLIREMVEKEGLTAAKAKSCLHLIEEVIKKEVGKGHKVVWTGLISFEKYRSNPRKGRNPKTGEALHIPAKDRIRAKVAGAWKGDYNQDVI